MANIAITKYCNLKCPYCFAETMMTEKEKKNIDLNTFKNILNWLEKTPQERIGLIGGEPTLHPNFKEILFMINNHCEKTGCKSILFTNGVELEKFLPYISPKMSILININDPKNMGNDNFIKLLSTLNILYLKNKLSNNNAQITCGCNICQEIQDYSFFWNLVDKYKLKKIRISITAPNDSKINKNLYYSNLKSIFMNFIEKAKIKNIKIILDCNHIPQCYFSQKELNSIINVLENKNIFENDSCEPCIDITADFKASPCFGTYNNLIDCLEFNNCEQLRNYFIKTVLVKKQNFNNQGKCINCKLFELKKCQGGCLKFSTF